MPPRANSFTIRYFVELKSGSPAIARRCSSFRSESHIMLDQLPAMHALLCETLLRLRLSRATFPVEPFGSRVVSLPNSCLLPSLAGQTVAPARRKKSSFQNRHLPGRSFQTKTSYASLAQQF